MCTSVSIHPISDKCHMQHKPAGDCVKAGLAMKAFELSGPLVKAVAQSELTTKQSVIKAKEKEIRSSSIKLLESLVKELHTLDSTLNKMYQQAGPGRGHPNGKAKIEYAKGKDCHRWLNGDCNRKECIFKHDPRWTATKLCTEIFNKNAMDRRGVGSVSYYV